MMHNDNNAPPKKSSSKGRDTWTFEENVANSIRLIRKLDPDDSSFLIDVAYIIGQALKNGTTSLAGKLYSLFITPATEPALPAQNTGNEDIAALHNFQIVDRIDKLSKERGKINTSIKKSAVEKSQVDNKILERKEKIQDEILDLVFRHDSDSITLNKEFARLEAETISLRNELKKTTDRINSVKETIKNERKNGAKSVTPLPLTDIAKKKELIDHIDTIMVAKVTMIRENIREHARKRVDIFFMLCIALYKRNVTVTNIPRAIVQLGSGSEITGTAACHASLIRNISIEPLPAATPITDTIVETIQSAAVKARTAANYMHSIFAQQTEAPPPEKEKIDAPDQPQAEPPFEFTYKDSYLEELLNITTELPTVVNDFNGLMEGKFGYESKFSLVGTEIVNQVACGKLHPFEAMEQYADIARKFYTSMDYTYFGTKKNSSVLISKRAAELIARYETEGTFSAFKPGSNLLLSEYKSMMLGLNTLSAGEKVATFFSYRGYVDERLAEMQKTILTAKPMRLAIEEEKKIFDAERKASKSKGFKK